jgi:hypothetical protein
MYEDFQIKDNYTKSKMNFIEAILLFYFSVFKSITTRSFSSKTITADGSGIS